MSKKEETVKEEVVTEKANAETKQSPNALLISMDLAEAIGQYLITKPMTEVEQLVSALRGSRSVTVTDKEIKED